MPIAYGFEDLPKDIYEIVRENGVFAPPLLIACFVREKGLSVEFIMPLDSQELSYWESKVGMNGELLHSWVVEQS